MDIDYFLKKSGWSEEENYFDELERTSFRIDTVSKLRWFTAKKTMYPQNTIPPTHTHTYFPNASAST